MLHIRSIRNASSTDEQILDAARSCLEEFGVRRTTLAEVARRAGVSRPTVYRRWPDTQALLADVLTREMRATIEPAGPVDADARRLLVRAVVDGSAAIRSHPLFDKLFRTDGDLMLTYIIERLGRSQREVVEQFAALIAAGQSDGSIRDGAVPEMATMVLLIAQSTVQSARMVAADLAGDRLGRELARAIDGYLRPDDKDSR